jgi:flagellar brake protein
MAETEVPAQPEPAPPRFELEQTDDYSKFLLYSKSEIVFVLRGLIQKGAMITVYFDHGKSFLLTSLLALSPDNNDLIVDIGSDEEMNRKALLADKLIFITMIDKVKVQFSLGKLTSAQHEGRQAFRGALPETLLRLQRREYFRLSTPIAHPVMCVIPLKRADGSTLVVDVPLLDLSGGGVGLMASSEQAALFETDMIFPDCKIALPDEGLLVATLAVRNTYEITTKNGSHHVRVGCEFIDLPSSRLTMIQRYITRVERERKARLSGLL